MPQRVVPAQSPRQPAPSWANSGTQEGAASCRQALGCPPSPHALTRRAPESAPRTPALLQELLLQCAFPGHRACPTAALLCGRALVGTSLCRLGHRKAQAPPCQLPWEQSLLPRATMAEGPPPAAEAFALCARGQQPLAARRPWHAPPPRPPHASPSVGPREGGAQNAPDSRALLRHLSLQRLGRSLPHPHPHPWAGVPALILPFHGLLLRPRLGFPPALGVEAAAAFSGLGVAQRGHVGVPLKGLSRAAEERGGKATWSMVGTNARPPRAAPRRASAAFQGSHLGSHECFQRGVQQQQPPPRRRQARVSGHAVAPPPTPGSPPPAGPSSPLGLWPPASHGLPPAQAPGCGSGLPSPPPRHCPESRLSALPRGGTSRSREVALQRGGSLLVGPGLGEAADPRLRVSLEPPCPSPDPTQSPTE